MIETDGIKIHTPLAPPKNCYRAEVSASEAIYRRGLGERVRTLVMALCFLGLLGEAVWAILLSIGLLVVSGTHRRFEPAVALMLLVACGFFVICAWAMLAQTGPRELRVLRRNRTYTYRVCAPISSNFLVRFGGQSNQDEFGLPWHTLKHEGTVEEMAGVAVQEAARKSTLCYSLCLYWKDPNRPAMRVGHALKEDTIYALQAQVADDLGVPLLSGKRA